MVTKILITLPAYNEEKSIKNTLKEIKEVVSALKEQPDFRKYNYSILVVDDGSTDDTRKIAKKENVNVFSNKVNLGLADTFQVELKKCLEMKADLIIHTDADGQYPAEYIPKLIKKWEEGYDLVLGSRFKTKGPDKMPLFNRLGNQAFSILLSKITNKKITDTTTGFRAISAKAAKEIEIINDFTYTQEQIIRAIKQNLKVGEIAITTRKTRKSRLFKSPIDYAIRAFINIFRIYRDYSPLYFFGRIGLISIILGVIIGFYVVLRITLLGSAGGIPKVILSMLLITLGVQIILFGFLADMFKK